MSPETLLLVAQTQLFLKFFLCLLRFDYVTKNILKKSTSIIIIPTFSENCLREPFGLLFRHLFEPKQLHCGHFLYSHYQIQTTLFTKINTMKKTSISPLRRNFQRSYTLVEYNLFKYKDVKQTFRCNNSSR